MPIDFIGVIRVLKKKLYFNIFQPVEVDFRITMTHAIKQLSYKFVKDIGKYG